MSRAPGLTMPAYQQPNENFLIRPMQLSDTWLVAPLAATEYFDSDLNAYLCSRRHEYPDHVTRRFARMIQGRYFNPRSLGFVAVTASSPYKPIAYAQFARLGNDEAALDLVAQRASFWRTLQKWWLAIQASIVDFFWPDRSVDHRAMRKFMRSVERDRLQYWDSPEMKAKYENRWQAQSVVVSSAYQRRGIGRMLMAEVLGRAQEEGVVVGLEASGEGERLYSSLGFALRGPFSMNVGPPAGGVMMWTPSKNQ
ncbi:uncharacterized protein N7459_005923 [Penicillium hispanicum]|uniref:uncharacterized protein n=1 Tax=Penicillium hispanicum TaxID=1080232 RepID=UPI002541028E|nr:uncharacterized protein N7459_005923 [Penicillium hispanicum]KAJ5579938.1 hypothetical protein N7459_005923 [Penicillium hispanicum]